MRLTKTQFWVITSLNILIAALVAVIFLMPVFRKAHNGGGGASEEKNDDPPVTETDAPPAHDKYRAATKGLVSEIDRETRLMGDGDETAVKTYFHDGSVYIFGNATVKGLDFDEYGGFLCVVDADGKIGAYSYFGEKVTATCVTADGYVAAAGNKLYKCGYDGTAVKTAETNGEIVGLKPIGDTVAAITQPETTSLEYTEYTVKGETWAAGLSTRIDSGYTLKYFDCFDFGYKRIIAARAHSLPRYDSFALYTFEPGGDAAVVYYGGTGENLTKPYAVMPYKGGYFALAAKNGVATVISVDYTFMSYHSYSLGFTTDGARLFYSDKKYYACFERADGSVTYELDDNMSRRRITELDGLSVDCVANIGGSLKAIGGITEKNATGVVRTGIAIIELATGKTTALDISGGSVCAATADPTVLVLSASGGSALSVPTGTDVYVVKLIA